MTEATTWCFEGQTRRRVRRARDRATDRLPVRAGETVGVDVDKELAEGGWYLELSAPGAEGEQQPQRSEPQDGPLLQLHRPEPVRRQRSCSSTSEPLGEGEEPRASSASSSSAGGSRSRQPAALRPRARWRRRAGSCRSGLRALAVGGLAAAQRRLHLRLEQLDHVLDHALQLLRRAAGAGERRRGVEHAQRQRLLAALAGGDAELDPRTGLELLDAARAGPTWGRRRRRRRRGTRSRSPCPCRRT